MLSLIAGKCQLTSNLSRLYDSTEFPNYSVCPNYTLCVGLSARRLPFWPTGFPTLHGVMLHWLPLTRCHYQTIKPNLEKKNKFLFQLQTTNGHFHSLQPESLQWKLCKNGSCIHIPMETEAVLRTRLSKDLDQTHRSAFGIFHIYGSNFETLHCQTNMEFVKIIICQNLKFFKNFSL